MNNKLKMYSFVVMPIMISSVIVSPNVVQENAYGNILSDSTTSGAILQNIDIDNNILPEIDLSIPRKYPITIMFEQKMEEAEKQKKIRKAQEKEERLKLMERERIKNVKFNSYNLLDVSGITYEEMYEVLSHSHYSNFLDFYSAFVDAEQKYGVNAFGLVAIAGLESGWNTSARANNGNNNITGMDVKHDGSVGTIYNSKYDCIMDLARQLKTYYLTEGAAYYNGYSTSQVNIKYSASPIWYKQVDELGDEVMAVYRELYQTNTY